MRYPPTAPDEFASPSGNSADSEFRSRRADSHTLAATTNAFALTLFSMRVVLSMYETAWAFPSLPTTISRAIAFAIRVNRPVACAGGLMTWLDQQFDAVKHPRSHSLQS